MRYREAEDSKAHLAPKDGKPVDMHTGMMLKLNKFRAERNFYMVAFTALLGLIVMRLRALTVEIVELQAASTAKKAQ